MFDSIDEIIEAHEENWGGYWFSPDAMAMFGTILTDEIFYGHYFITGDMTADRDSSVRRYTIRFASDRGAIQTVGDFLEFDSYEDAAEALRNGTHLI